MMKRDEDVHKALTITERDIEEEVSDYVGQLGGLSLRVAPVGVRGFPDRTMLLPGGSVVFIEFKRPGGLVSVHQIKWIELLRDRGFEVWVCDDVEFAKEIIDNVMLRSAPIPEGSKGLRPDPVWGRSTWSRFISRPWFGKDCDNFRRCVEAARVWRSRAGAGDSSAPGDPQCLGE